MGCRSASIAISRDMGPLSFKNYGHNFSRSSVKRGFQVVARDSGGNRGHIEVHLQKWGVAEGSSISWVAKSKGDKIAE